jgi:hypothetical protein
VPFDTSESISLLSAIIAVLSALYAGRQAKQAKTANEIAIKTELKPRRLAAYSSFKAFLHFCSTYRTIQGLESASRTRNLTEKISEFEWEIAQQGPLDMPEVDELMRTAIQKAWQLQRTIDRLAGPNPKSLDPKFTSAEDFADSLEDWFSSSEKQMIKLFDPYLRIAQ